MSIRLFIILAIVTAALVGAAIVVHNPGAARSLRSLGEAIHGSR